MIGVEVKSGRTDTCVGTVEKQTYDEQNSHATCGGDQP